MHGVLAASAVHPQLGDLFPLWSVLPFAAMLLSIAILPLLAPGLWEHNRNKAILSFVLGAPVAIWTASLESTAVVHAAGEYLAFILLLGALFVISGGIVVRGTLAGTPGLNMILLAIGAVLASMIGTTGASMLLVRPLLRANSVRIRKAHVFIFFIFVVANGGGLLTPMGDPPLFLGFLRGVPFTWPLRLWREWMFANGILLILFSSSTRPSSAARTWNGPATSTASPSSTRSRSASPASRTSSISPASSPCSSSPERWACPRRCRTRAYCPWSPSPG